MGTLVGHVSPGIGLLLLGLWHGYNTMALYARAPAQFRTRLWFEPRNARGVFRYAELLLIIMGCCLSLLGELFISPASHLPLEKDLSIPVHNLNNMEHSMIFFFIIIYNFILLYVDASGARVPEGFLQVLATAMLGVVALVFHFHSSDHAGVEGRFHWFFQLLVLLTMACTLIEIGCPASFVVTLVRSLSFVFQGVWMIHMGVVLFVPAFVAKGCNIGDPDNESDVLVCDGPKAVLHAKALANLQFCLYLAILLIATVAFVLKMTSATAAAADYQSLHPRKAAFTLHAEHDDEEAGRTVHALNVQSSV